MAQGGRTACAISGGAVSEAIRSTPIDMTTEAASQADIEAALRHAFGRDAVSREHRLGPADRPDFLVGGRIVVEVKGPRHREPSVLRQIMRYAAYPQVEVIVVATSRALRLPLAIGGVPVWTINLGRAWL